MIKFVIKGNGNLLTSLEVIYEHIQPCIIIQSKKQALNTDIPKTTGIYRSFEIG